MAEPPQALPSRIAFLPGICSANPPVFSSGGQPDAGDYAAIRGQTKNALDQVARALDSRGMSLEGTVKVHLFTTHTQFVDYIVDEWESRTHSRPAWTSICLGQESLHVRGAGALLDITATASPVTTSDTLTNEGVAWAQAGNLVFLSGLMGVAERNRQVLAREALPNPDAPLPASAMALQTDAALARAGKVLHQAGIGFDHIARAQVYLTDLAQFPDFDAVWKRHFGRLPARTTVQVAELPVPGALVSIDLIAATGSEPVATPPLENLRLQGLPLPKAAYQPAVAVDDLLFMAGQLASDFKTGIAVEARVDPNFRFYDSRVTRQSEYVLENLERLLQAAGGSLGSIRKANVFIRQGASIHDFFTVWDRRVASDVPTTVVAVPGDGLLVPGTEVEIELVAQIPMGRAA